eukprot:4064181-Prymnesium_polylepis.1
MKPTGLSGGQIGLSGGQIELPGGQVDQGRLAAPDRLCTGRGRGTCLVSNLTRETVERIGHKQSVLGGGRGVYRRSGGDPGQAGASAVSGAG